MTTTPAQPQTSEMVDKAVTEALRRTRERDEVHDAWLVSVEPGYGYHQHDDGCAASRGDTPYWPCMRDCDDSDLILTVAWKSAANGRTWEMIYGSKDNGEKVTLWMD